MTLKVAIFLWHSIAGSKLTSRFGQIFIAIRVSYATPYAAVSAVGWKPLPSRRVHKRRWPWVSGGGHAALVVDAQGTAHVAYYDWDKWIVKYVRDNTPPIAEDDRFETLVNTAVSGNVLLNDGDLEEDPIRVTAEVTIDVQVPVRIHTEPELEWWANEADGCRIALRLADARSSTWVGVLREDPRCRP
jgi:hypothetical protein